MQMPTVMTSLDRRQTSIAGNDSISSPGGTRTLEDVRNEVAYGIANRAISRARTIDGVKAAVYFTFSKREDDLFLQLVADHIDVRLAGTPYLFALATTGSTTASGGGHGELPVNSLVINGSDEDHVQRAVLLASSKFLGRVENVPINRGTLWVALVHDMGASSYDETALWDVVAKSVRAPVNPLVPPRGSRSIDQILSDARARLQRVTPQQAYDELHDPKFPMPVFLVDIRPVAQREREGGIHGSLIIERNVLEWRFDPRCEARLAIADRYDLKVIIYCQEGYTSSLAAASLHDLGLLNATDIIGGYAAWKEAGLPGQINPPVSEYDDESYGFSHIPSELSESAIAPPRYAQ